MAATALHLAFAGVGTFLVYREYRRLVKARASLQWKQTEGRILNLRIEEGSPSDEDSGFDRDEGSYRPKVRYSYVVNGREFVSSNLSFRPLDVWGYSAAIDAVAGIRRGTIVPVYYNPQNLAEAVLIPGPGTSSYALIGSYVVFLLVLGVSIWRQP